MCWWTFSEPLDDELQAVLSYAEDLPRVLELALEIGIYAAPAYESRLSAEGDGEDGWPAPFASLRPATGRTAGRP